MKTPTLPLTLYKANLDLWLRIGELLEESRNQWATLLVRELQDGATGSGLDLDALRRGDWQTLALLPGQALQRLAAHGVGDLQAAAQTALGNQMTFATGFQQALSEWQQATLDALGDATGTDAGADAQALFGQALQDVLAWPESLAGLVPGATPRAPDAAGTPARPAAPSGSSRSRAAAGRTAAAPKKRAGTATGSTTKKTAGTTAGRPAKRATRKHAPRKRSTAGASASTSRSGDGANTRTPAKKTAARKKAARRGTS